MRRVWLYFKKDLFLNIFVAIEYLVSIVILGIVLNMSAQVEGSDMAINHDAVTLIGYLVLAVLTLLLLTTITEKVVNREKNRYYYAVCYSLGSTKGTLLLSNTIKNCVMYLLAIVVLWSIVPFVAKSDVAKELYCDVTYMVYASLIVFLYVLIMIVVDVVIIYRTDLLKNFEGAEQYE